jgi:hypothetical protein
LRIEPESALIFEHLACACSRKGAFEEAVAYGLKSVELDPNPRVRWHLAEDQMRTGRYREGWKNLRAMDELTGRANPEPKWDGSALDGRTLVAYAVAGLGDTIQFVRFLPQAIERARGTVIFECQPGLVELLGDMPGVAAVVPQRPDPYPADCYVSLMALPDVLQTTEETLPSGLLPARIPEEAMAVWRERLAGLSGLKVGLCWSGKPDTHIDQARSTHLETFAPLATVKGLSLVSLQLGHRADEVLSASHYLDILHVPEDLSPMTKTAALMRQLDLVISVDTSIAHLAGALGVETWLLTSLQSIWWDEHRPHDTIWYPRHRLFRQRRRYDWEALIERVRSELAARATSG